MGAIGPVPEGKQADAAQRLERFPYACCEIGGGMQSSYDRRVFVAGKDCAALALVKLGCGNNLPGYYMYQGGINPDGKYTDLNECKATGSPNNMPVKDYDFNAPLGACGELREQYYLLREQHLFLRGWGSDLARMPAFFPAKQPVSLDDTETVRWSVRSDGTKAFLFFNNYQRFGRLPPKKGMQFSLKMQDGVHLVPQAPVTIPSGVYGMWPVNMDCAGVSLAYATAQPLCRLDEKHEHWFFFAAIDGMAPEFRFAGKQSELIQNIEPGSGIAFSRKASDCSDVHFVVLPPDQAKHLWKMPLAGCERVILSPDAVLPDADTHIRIETTGAELPELAILPSVKSARFDGVTACATEDGAFQRFQVTALPPPVSPISCDAVKPDDAPGDKPFDAVQEDAWKHAAVWKLNVPAGLSSNQLLRIEYAGDAARVYAGGTLVVDNFYNGQPFDTTLCRIPATQRNDIEIRILPFRADRTYTLHNDTAVNERTQPLRIVALPRRQWTVELDGGGE